MMIMQEIHPTADLELLAVVLATMKLSFIPASTKERHSMERHLARYRLTQKTWPVGKLIGKS